MNLSDWLIPWRKSGFLPWLGFSALIGILAIGGIWIWVINSSAYEAASEYARRSPDFTNRFGEIRDISLRSFKVSTSDASFRMRIGGVRSSGTVIVYLKDHGGWKVEKAAFDE